MVKWSYLVHMFIIPIDKISDMEAIVNVRMWAVAAIFKNGRHAIYIGVYLPNYEAHIGKYGVKVYVLGVKD